MHRYIVLIDIDGGSIELLIVARSDDEAWRKAETEARDNEGTIYSLSKVQLCTILKKK
jgi:hypothetical protein